MADFYYVYVLQGKKDQKWYTGFTSELQQRVKRHNKGKVRSTKGRGPFEVIYYEAYRSSKDARSREQYLKSGPGKRYLKERLNNDPALDHD